MKESQRSFTKEEVDDIVKQELKDFKKFAFQSSMIQTAIAFILGASFKNVVTSLSENIIMPFVNFFIGQTGEAWRSMTFTPFDDMVFEIGKFGGSFIDFLITAMVLYFIYKRIMGKKIEDSNEQSGTKN